MPEDLPESSLPRPVVTRGHTVWIAALFAFVLGAGAASWLGWRSGADFGRLVVLSNGTLRFDRDPGARLPAPSPLPSAPGNAAPNQSALADRVAGLEQRLDRLDLRVEAASGNAARAEALLVAFAVRRVVERGAPLGYLADQLKLRFADAQPNAVATIINETRDMVPLDQLAARLAAMAPQLTATGQQSVWRRVTRELREMLVIRSDRPARSDAEARFDEARRALSAGRIDEAIADVQRLSTSSDAANWSAAARHYRNVERALDLIDTTALLEPHQLHNAAGYPVANMVQ